MSINFQNGSSIKVNDCNEGINIRGTRSNFITVNCFDTETQEWVIKTLDIRIPFDRYIPEYLYIDWMMKNEN
jgi:hypothetical protein